MLLTSQTSIDRKVPSYNTSDDPGPERDPRDSTLSSGTRSMLEKLKESTQVELGLQDTVRECTQ